MAGGNKMKKFLGYGLLVVVAIVVLLALFYFPFSKSGVKARD
jgi:hypothetical protein